MAAIAYPVYQAPLIRPGDKMGSNEDKGTTKEITKDTSDSSKAMEDISNEDKGIHKGENEWQTKGEFWPGSDWNSTDMSTIHFLPLF